MALAHWILHHWFIFLQTGALGSGLLLACTALFLDARARRVSNLIQLTQQHRDLWERMYSDPELERILDPAPELAKAPITAQEEMFTIFLVLHLSNTYYAMKSGLFPKLRGLRKDIEVFFSLPIPRAVWEKVKVFQEPPFVRFVERCRASEDLGPEERS